MDTSRYLESSRHLLTHAGDIGGLTTAASTDALTSHSNALVLRSLLKGTDNCRRIMNALNQIYAWQRSSGYVIPLKPRPRLRTAA